jgi:hypothetical protein
MLETLQFIDELIKFQKFVFQQLNTNNIVDFSNSLNSKQGKKSNIAAKIQDDVMNSSEFNLLSSHIGWKKLAAKKMGTKVEDIEIVFPHFRLDLPIKFSKDHQKMSLPWHQEAAYYLRKGNCSPKSIVMSTYLHDCNQKNGAIAIGIDNNSDLINHDEKYIDNLNKRFFRVSCEEPREYQIIETILGQTIIFDFLTPHRSGINNSQNTRLTFLLRASSKIDVEHWEKENNLINQ